MLTLWNKVKEVPETAQKPITGGRLNGYTDINPMWRLKTLTEQFGICGIGWKYTITEKWLEKGEDNQVAAFVNIDLFIKVNGEWSEAIPGTGGSLFIAKERGGMYTSDECYKMAMTDAISVACKALGIGSDVYWDKDKSKYGGKNEPQKTTTKATTKGQGNTKTTTKTTTKGTAKATATNDTTSGMIVISNAQAKRMYALSGGNADLCKKVIGKYGYLSSKGVLKKDYDNICQEIEKIVHESSNAQYGDAYEESELPYR